MFDRYAFRAKVVEKKMTLSEVANEIGMNPTTLSRKMCGNSDFTRSEIQSIRALLSMTTDEAERIFFAEELT